MNKRIGDRVMPGALLCTLHVNPASDYKRAYDLLMNAIHIGAEAPEKPTLIYETVE